MTALPRVRPPLTLLVDLDPQPTLLAGELAGEFGYRDGGPVTGRYEAAEPFPVRIDLTTALV